MGENKTVSGFHLGKIKDKELLKDAMTELFKLYTKGAIKPHVDEVFAFEDVSLPDRPFAALHAYSP